MNQKQAKTLKKLVRWAERNEKAPKKLEKLTWSQETWATKHKDGPEARCQTACCIAGGAVVLAGAKFLYDKRELNEDGVVDVTECEYNGVEHNISELAQTLLGLTTPEADDLFDGDNNLGDVKRISKRILKDYGYA